MSGCARTFPFWLDPVAVTGAAVGTSVRQPVLAEVGRSNVGKSTLVWTILPAAASATQIRLSTNPDLSTAKIHIRGSRRSRQ